MERMKKPYGGCFHFVPYRRMAEAKKCPVDRGKLLIALECCRLAKCRACPYSREELDVCQLVLLDALSYIYYLEEQLGVNGS